MAEGEKTEPQYFEGLSLHLNAQAVQIIRLESVGLGRDPLRVVNAALKLRDVEEKEGDPYDAVWCVVDVDQHATLEPACHHAKRNGLEIAVSSPCFEVWLLWHFQEHAGWITSQSLSEKLKKFGFTDKNLPESFPYAEYSKAKVRAERCAEIRQRHDPPNPSSSVSALVGVLAVASKRSRQSHG
ncbi:RloB family protein [Actinacidiphila polyblastidii]|uniref:RloB family protein n=1 Tax=Actinacidiphila polyblastidii TaxID=3110430 RepID=UPI0039BCB7F6